jgi:glycopeptide antibiotics resistance protein
MPGQDFWVTNVESTPTTRRERTLLVVLFVVYLVLLVWIILWKLEIPWVGKAALLPRPIKLVPYLPSGDAGASTPGEVAANIALFVPFGIYLGLLAPSWRWWQLTAVFVGASVLLETVQHLLSTGSFDTSDVIDNTVGGVVGLGLLALARRRLRTRAVAIVTRICLIGAVVAVLAVAVFIASPLRYEAQRDVVVPRPTVSVTP